MLNFLRFECDRLRESQAWEFLFNVIIDDIDNDYSLSLTGVY